MNPCVDFFSASVWDVGGPACLRRSPSDGVSESVVSDRLAYGRVGVSPYFSSESESLRHAAATAGPRPSV